MCTKTCCQRKNQNCRAWLELGFDSSCICLTSCDATTLFLLKDPWFHWIGFCCNGTLPEPNSKDTELGYLPSVNLHEEKLFQHLYKLSETEVCFLHIQLVGTKHVTSEMHKISPDVAFEPSKPPAKSESWNNPNLHCCAVFPHDNVVLKSLVCECKKSNVLNACRTLSFHFVMERTSLLTDHKISSLPIRTKYKHFRTNRAHTFDISPTDPISSSSNFWSSIHGNATSCNPQIVLFANSQYLFMHVLARPLRNVCFGFYE